MSLGGSRIFSVNVKLHSALNWSFGNSNQIFCLQNSWIGRWSEKKKKSSNSYLCHVDKTLGGLTDYFHCIVSHHCHFHSEFNCHIFPWIKLFPHEEGSFLTLLPLIFCLSDRDLDCPVLRSWWNLKSHFFLFFLIRKVIQAHTAHFKMEIWMKKRKTSYRSTRQKKVASDLFNQSFSLSIW